MSTPLYDQGLRDQRNRCINRDTKPKIVILTDGKGLIESPHPFKQFSGHHYSRRANKAKIEAWAEDISRRLTMLLFRIYPHPVPDPDLFRLAYLDLRQFFHIRYLNFQFFRLPEIIGIQKGQVSSTRAANPEITRRRYPAPGLRNNPKAGSVLRQMLGRAVL